MAGDWIKLEHSTPDKPEVFRIAETLSIAPEHALGCLIRVWMWADQQIAKGNAVNVTETSVDRIARVDGFGSAMASAGWLATTTTGVEFPNFERHNGQTAKTRALTAKRVAKFKAEKGNDQVTIGALPREEKSIKKKKEAEPEEITNIEFQVTGDPDKPSWFLPVRVVAILRSAFPSLDVMAEARKAAAWCALNPANRKTANGMTRFLNGWMTRAQNNGKADRKQPKLLIPEDNMPPSFDEFKRLAAGGSRHAD